MKFESEDEAFDYWQDAYYCSGKGYEGTGRSFDDQVDMFKDWVDEEKITWVSIRSCGSKDI